MKKIKNIHPGEILLEEFVKPMGMLQKDLAKKMKVSNTFMHNLIHGKAKFGIKTDSNLNTILKTSRGFWLGLQLDYDIEQLKNKRERIGNPNQWLRTSLPAACANKNTGFKK